MIREEGGAMLEDKEVTSKDLEEVSLGMFIVLIFPLLCLLCYSMAGGDGED